MQLFALLTLLGDLGLVVLLLAFVYAKFIAGKGFFEIFPPFVEQLARSYSLVIAAGMALFSTVGSLILSEVLALPPCELCWYQRALMYPQAIILAVAAVDKDTSVSKYILPLSGIGLIIATYHYTIQIFPDFAATCGIGKTSCSDIFEMYYGYITIPVMSITGFLYTGIFTYLARILTRKEEIPTS